MEAYVVKTFQVGDIVHLLTEEPRKADIQDLGFNYYAWDSEDLRQRVGMECRITRARISGREMREHAGGYDVIFHDGFETSIFGYDVEEFYKDFSIPKIEESDLLGLLGGM